jgi:hypothetical protein
MALLRHIRGPVTPNPGLRVFPSQLNLVLSGNFQGAGTIVHVYPTRFEHSDEDYFAMFTQV